MISLNRFFFQGKYSTDYDVLTDLCFEDDNGTVDTFLNRESVSSTIYDGSRKNIHNFKYTDTLAPKFILVKKDFSDFTKDENRRILSWLTASNKVEKMVCYKDDSKVISFILIGNITQIEQRKISNDRVIGYEFIFEHIAPWAYSPIKTITKTITTPESFIIDYKADVYERHLYPKIQVTIGKSNNDGILCLPTSEDPMVDGYEMLDNTVYQYNNDYYVKVNGQKQALSGIFATDIENQTTDATTYNKYYLCNTDNYIYKGIIDENSKYAWEKLIKVGAGFEIKNTYYENGQDITVSSIVTDNYENEIITIDGDNRIIASSETPMRVIGNSFNWEWIYFVPGENNITIYGNCTVIFQWVEPIKIGNL